jgi:hypothetical protein
MRRFQTRWTVIGFFVIGFAVAFVVTARNLP